MGAAKKKKKKPTPQELEQRHYRSEIRSVFRNAGFKKVFSVSDKEFSYRESTGDFDDVFLLDNVIIFSEYTISKSEYVSNHLKKKKILFDLILDNPADFIEFFEQSFSKFKEARDNYYDIDHCQVKILYCSKNSINPKHKTQQPKISFLDYPILRYFKSVSTAIKRSSRFEIFNYLGLSSNQIGKPSLSTSTNYDSYKGSILPHNHSNFDKGYKVVSFYIDPNSLLSRSYVLRRDGWREDNGLYQRLISSYKINSIRKYLNEKQRVFINNIIVTLPNSTKLLNDKGDTINPVSLVKTEPVTIQIPNGFNVIGLIDGQHRVYSYHEGGRFDEKIGKLREKQNLLVTGIIYPNKIEDDERVKFEANLFLEINTTQTKTSSELKQSIGLLLNPFSSESIAKAILIELNNNGPLEDKFQRHFFDKDKLKTTSIVSYGLKPIIKLSGNDSFFRLWPNPKKSQLQVTNDTQLLNEYIIWIFR